jgi:hypothetical protein
MTNLPLHAPPPNGPTRRPVWYRRHGFWRLIGLTILFGLAAPTVGHIGMAWFGPGDPKGVNIDQLNREIDPKAAIASACHNTITGVKHLENPAVGPDDRYQRWSVVPIDGHVDRAMLDTRTGKVVCP